MFVKILLSDSFWSIAVTTVLFGMFTMKANESIKTKDSLIPFSFAFSTPFSNRRFCSLVRFIFRSASRIAACFENRSPDSFESFASCAAFSTSSNDNSAEVSFVLFSAPLRYCLNLLDGSELIINLIHISLLYCRCLICAVLFFISFHGTIIRIIFRVVRSCIIFCL